MGNKFLALAIGMFFLNSLMAQPVISSFSPTSGSIGTVVTITGNNFGNSPGDNVVYFGAVRGTISVASPTSLAVIVPPGFSYEPITVTANGLTAYSNQPFTVSFAGQGNCNVISNTSFNPLVNFNTGTSPREVKLADIDGDNLPDAVTANNDGQSISILRNTSSQGFISFAPKIDSPSANSPAYLSIADLDGDGKLDIVTATLSAKISIFKNTSTPGSVSLAPRIDINTGSSARGLTLRDIDMDGKPDILMTISSGSVFIFRNTSSAGNISFAAAVNFATGSGPAGIATGDINNDGLPDIATANSSGSSISILKNMSSPGVILMAPRIDIAISPVSPSKISIADVDSDGSLDIVTLSTNISVLRNTSIGGTISFAPPVNYVTTTFAAGLTISDLSGDGKPDIAAAVTSASILILKNTCSIGNISFAPPQNYPTGTSPEGLAIADIDVDGRPDIAVSIGFISNSVSILRKVSSEKIFLVDSSRTGNATMQGICKGDVIDWTKAVRSLQSAIDSALDGDQIWVAGGTYFPTKDKTGNENPLDARSKTFAIKSGIKIYGGFSGNESNIIDRSGSVVTRLSGEISGQNAYAVVTIENAGNTTTLDGTTVSGGSATPLYTGGGIRLANASAIISNCVVTGNSSLGVGGGMYIDNSNPAIINCLLTFNSAQSGGAIATNNSAASIINCNIARNTVLGDGGGLYSQGSTAQVIYNSIVWGNQSSAPATNNIASSGASPIVQNSIIEQASGVYAGTSNLNTNPLFINADSGNFKLINGSAAIGAGNSTNYPATAPSKDLVGNPRVQGSSIDIGCHEGGNAAQLNAMKVLFVDSSASTPFGNGSSWNLAYPKLADAVSVLNGNNDVQEIWIAKGTYLPLNDDNGKPNPSSSNLGKATFLIKNGVNLYGGFNGTENSITQRSPATNVTILNGISYPSGYEFRVDRVVYMKKISKPCLVDGLTVIGGGGSISLGGGGIYIESANVNINNCIFKNNMSNALQTDSASSKITNCDFSGNAGQSGGAISNLLSTVVIDNCKFHDNVVTVWDNSLYRGGAMFNLRSTVTINNCDFLNNRAAAEGGAISNDDATCEINNSRFIGNKAMNLSGVGGYGGIMSNQTSTVKATNCLFTKSYAAGAAAFRDLGTNATFINCTITDNSANFYGGIYHGDASYVPSSTTVVNSIVWGNHSFLDSRGDNFFDGATNTVVGTFIVNYSLVGHQPGIFPGTANLNADPKFIDTALGNCNLQPISPAIESGSNAGYTGNLSIDTDLNGMPRLTGDKIDIGTYEFSLNYCPSGNAIISSAISGTVYQWQVNSGAGFTDLFDNANYSGTQSSTLQLNNIPSAWNGNQYRCVVNGTIGRALTIKIVNQWLGTIDNAWENASNWSCTQIPDVNTDVLINSGTVIVNSNVTCRSLTVRPGATVIVRPGYQIVVTH